MLIYVISIPLLLRSERVPEVLVHTPPLNFPARSLLPIESLKYNFRLGGKESNI